MTTEIRTIPNGKGDHPRPYNPEVYAREHERIFGKKKPSPKPTKSK